jgi:uncharacterized protein YndB with AHSA1/START domain
MFAFLIAAALICALLYYASTLPESAEVARSVHISAPPERIFPLIDNPRAMNEWNPFVKADPNVKLSYSGPESGVGAANDFEGNGKVGAGRAEIIESISPAKVVVSLRMDRPFKCRNRVEFTIAPRTEGSDVTWAMSGSRPFIGKLMSVFISAEKMVGPAFEAGLADLKAKAEA